MSKTTRPSLLAAVYSSDPDSRLAAGEVFYTMINAGDTISRRLEEISIRDIQTISRRVSVDLDYIKPSEIADRNGILLDVAILSVIPKSLYYGLEIQSSNGLSLASVDRSADSRMAQAFLVYLARRLDATLPNPPEAVWMRLLEHAYRFPRIHTSLAPESKEYAAEIGAGLLEESMDWWNRASEFPRWRSWLGRFETSFILAVGASKSEPLTRRYIFIRDETPPEPLSTKVRNLVNNSDLPERRLAIPLYDLGRARSEHIILRAPDRTFLSGGILVRHLKRPLPYRRRASRGIIVLYSKRRDGAIGNCRLVATLWPRADGLIFQVLALGLYTSIIIATLSVLQFLFNIVGRLSGNLSSVIAIMFVVPAALNATLFRPRESDLEWAVYRRWRAYGSAISCLLPIMSAIFLFPSDHAWAWVDGLLMASVGAVAIRLTGRIGSDRGSVRERYNSVLRDEFSPAKGIRLFVE